MGIKRKIKLVKMNKWLICNLKIYTETNLHSNSQYKHEYGKRKSQHFYFSTCIPLRVLGNICTDHQRSAT